MNTKNALSNRKYDTAIFDLDGTLLNTLGDLTDSVNFALKSCGFPIHTESEIKAYVGNGIAKLIDRAVPKEASDEEKIKTLELFRKHYSMNCENKTQPYEGIPELLAALQTAGLKLAVVSNKIDSAVSKLCKKYFGSYIMFSVGDREGLARKPAPDAVLEVLKQLESAPENAIYIGDSDVDIQTAKNAGMDCISVTWGFRDKNFLIRHGASFTVDKPSAIMKILVPEDEINISYKSP